MHMQSDLRIGIDLGGTKVEAVLMDRQNQILHRLRVATPVEDYQGQIAAIVGLVDAMEAFAGQGPLSVGVGHPGAISPALGVIKNANSLCLNGKPLQKDLEQTLGRLVRMANDANCLAVSEHADGAAAGASSCFAVILGTGVGGAAVIHGSLLVGANAIAGEWGHNPMPWPRAEWAEVPGPLHWDGRFGAIEAYLSGPGMARDYAVHTGIVCGVPQIMAEYSQGGAHAIAAVQRYNDRLARALASIINVLDPAVIVLGGGLSNVPELYQDVERLWGNWVFSDHIHTRLVKAVHGDSSGVRGAAWLWP